MTRTASGPRNRARGAPQPLPDYVGPGLKLLFVGINPGLMSAAAGHYYANPRNSFWRLLYESGLTPMRLSPREDHLLPRYGYGLTDIVKRPSRGAADLERSEFRAGRERLLQLIEGCKPAAVCFNGKTAFAGCFGPEAFRGFGPQRVRIAGVPVFVLPSTSPAHAAMPFSVKLRYFRLLKKWLERTGRPTLPENRGAGAERAAKRKAPSLP